MVVVFSTIISLMGDDLPNGHAPISVMADHFHKKGEIMFSYRFMNMGMSKDFQGYEETMKVKAMGYKYYGTKMDMQMHMLGAMYGFTDKITIMTMINLPQLFPTRVKHQMTWMTKFHFNYLWKK